MNWEAETSLALAQILGIAAIVGSLLVWRAVEFSTANRRRMLLSNCAAGGLLQTSALRELHSLRVRTIAFWLACYASVHFFWHVFSYLDFTNWLVDHRVGMDWAQANTLLETSRIALGHAIRVGTIAVFLLAVEWAVQLRGHEYRGSLPPRFLSAAETIPLEWRSAPRALWEARVAELERLAWVKSDRAWIQSWPAWTTVVVTQRRFASARLLDESRAGDDSSLPVALNTSESENL